MIENTHKTVFDKVILPTEYLVVSLILLERVTTDSCQKFLLV
jgi:hypothetical protein